MKMNTIMNMVLHTQAIIHIQQHIIHTQAQSILAEQVEETQQPQ
jgi:hypothetical protein